MPRIAPLDPAAASGTAKELLDAVQAKLGATPNMMRTMAVAPAVLEGYLGLAGALAGGRLGGALGERIALEIAEANACAYCLSAHAYLGEHLAKLSDAEIEAARHGRADARRDQAALAFARAVLDARGDVSDADLAAARDAGLGDAELAEVVAHVALNVFTNYFNRAAGVEIDFPVVWPAAPLAA